MKKFLLLTFLFLVISIQAQSQPYPYTLPVTLMNGGSSATNVQVLIKINTASYISATLMKADGGDIRFYDSPALTTQLNFYIEGYLNTDSTKIWVMIPSLPAGNTSIYCNFGNPSATTVSTLSIFEGPHSSIDSLTLGNVNTTPGISNSSRGFRFTATSELLITNFGKYEPTGTTRYLTMWDFNTQQIVKQSQVSGPATTWSYDTLSQAFWIQPGVMYIMSLFQGSGDGYYWQASSQVGQHLTYLDMRYCNTCTQNTFPTLTLTNLQYGYPDFLYYLRNSISPVPTYTVGTLTGITNGNGNVPDEFALRQNYPNPFNPVTKISYDIPKGSQVRLTVYDMLGREVTQLVNEYKDAGSYEAVWNGVSQTSGVYFYRIEAGDFTQKMKMILVK
jgi:hypothetical protein